jgi:protein-disulfide isomerase
MTRLKKDLGSSEIDTTIREGRSLGSKLGLNGTPSYIIGKKIVIGAVGQEELQSVVTEQKKTL